MEPIDQSLRQLAASPESLDADTLRRLRDAYPYFQLPAMALMKYHKPQLGEKEIAELELHLALTSGDKKALFDIMSDRSDSFADLYPPAPPARPQTTDNALDTFFANYGTADSAETQLLERLIFNPTPDYSEILLREDTADAPADATDSLVSRIDAFVRDHSPAHGNEPDKTAAPAPRTPPRPEAEPGGTTVARHQSDNSLLSESLAKIFIKQGRYERAYEIISNLSLNYPKKSIYFADQLRFLQKLIKIRQAQMAD